MHLVPMKEDHIEEAQALTTSFNWPHTVEDWSFAFRHGVGCVAHDQGKLVGTCLTWSLGTDVASLGLLAVARECQGRGLGRTLLRHALNDRQDQTVLLHATAQAIDLYTAEKFSPLGEVRQHQGIVLAAGSGSASTTTVQGRDVPAATVQWIHDQDWRACALDRRALFEGLLRTSNVTFLGALDAPEGFALTRKFGRGLVIGPVIAPSEQDARFLISDILDANVGRFARIDVTAQFAQTRWLGERGLPEVDRVLAMSNAPLPTPQGAEQRFALIGHAFG